MKWTCVIRFSDSLNIVTQGRLKVVRRDWSSLGKRTARCGWILRRVGLYTDRAEVPFGKFLGLPFMRLSGRRADCLPRMV
ncbi:hypothetical protein [Neisseria elongata]|uniref:hypothetical protein n=1 Tax=Neisseria elongata TaxID=495 RepID=UPI0028D0B544|nr:hypothetical protein [Neisseria elongata]